MTQRDAFFEGLTERMMDNGRFWVLAGDLTCDMAKRFAHRFPKRFINTGPMEQTMVDVAIGLAASGALPVVFGIAPFVIHRAQEQIRLAAMMRSRITIVGVGAGWSYEEAGPTHHGTDDYAAARVFPGITAWTCSDEAMARFLVSKVGEGDGPQYFRLDRQESESVHHTLTVAGLHRDLDKGYWVHGKTGDKTKGLVITHGAMLHRVLELGLEGYPVVEVLRYPVPDDVAWLCGKYPWVVVDEGGYRGGLATAVWEAQSRGMCAGMGEDRHYEYITGGREAIRAKAGLSGKELGEWIVRTCV